MNNTKRKLILRAALVLKLAVLAVVTPALAGGSEDDFEIEGRDIRGIPTLVKGYVGQVDVNAVEASAIAFLEEFSATTLEAKGSEGFTVRSIRTDTLGQTHLRTRQTIHGLPVIGAGLAVHFDSETGVVSAVNGRFTPDEDLLSEPGVDAELSLSLAYADAEIHDPEILVEPELVYVLDIETLQPALVWDALVSYESEGDDEIDRIFADALEGGLVARHPQIDDARNRETFFQGSDTPTMVESSVVGRDAVDTATHANAGIVYDYYFANHGRDSIDDDGMTITSVVHFGNNFNNALWVGDRMLFGDGDGVRFSPLGGCQDVVAHEYTHGVTNHEVDLFPGNESGPLDESLSDIFAAAVDRWALTAGTDPWLLAEGCFTPGTPGDALRFLNDPTLDGASADHVDNFIPGARHANAGISNLAFHLLVEGGQHPRGLEPHQVFGIGMADAAAIFYHALTENLFHETMGFAEAADLTVLAAEQLYGVDSNHAQQTRRAWCAVGVDDPKCPPITISGSYAVFFSQFIVTLQTSQLGPSANVDIFRDGQVISTVPNTGAAFSDFLSLFPNPGTTNYWVCEAGSTAFYEPDFCSNVVSLLLEF